MKFLCVLCVLCGCGLSTFALNREAFTITKYDLEVRLEPDQQRLGARGKITLRNDSAGPQKLVVLQISSSLNWRAIKLGGKAIQYVTQPYVSDIDHTGALSEAIVTLPAEIKPKDSVELEIGYEGTVPLDATRLMRAGVPEEIAKRASWDQISPAFTAVRGAGYVAWYPISTESADFSEGNSLFEVSDRWKAREADSAFTAKLGMDGKGGDTLPMVICTPERASLIETTNRAQRTSTECSWEKLGTATPTFAMARYDNWDKPPLSLLSLPDHEAGAAKYTVAFEPASQFVTRWFGPPTAPVAIADLADPHAPAFESGALLLASMADEDTKLAGINLVHELTHSAVWSPRPWVYEGLAHFAEALYREEQGGRQAALDFLSTHRAAFLDTEKEVAASPSPSKSADQALATTFDETYYRSKAAYVWWMLRDMVGDAALKQALHNYRGDEDKELKYVQHLLEAASKKDLTWFFDDWVYQDRGLPEIRVSAAHPWKTEKAQMITVTLENSGNVGAEVPFTIRGAGNNVTARLEVRAKGTATMRLELSGAPAEIEVNDGSVPENDLTNHVVRIAITP